MLETIKNLAKAYVGESQARNRYTFYAKIAREEKYNYIADVFEETAYNEKEHARVLFELLTELVKKEKMDMSELEIEAAVPIVIGSTKDNLQAAMEGERYENTTMYPEFAEIADKEGLKQIAIKLRAISQVEVHHEERYKALLALVEEEKFYKREKKVLWICSECGHIYEGEEPPKLCPLCKHPYNYFEVNNDVF